MKMAIGIIIFVLVILGGCLYLTMGDGGFKRMVTITGVYSICKPDGYPTVCFLDADSPDGGLSCVPYQGDCKK